MILKSIKFEENLARFQTWPLSEVFRVRFVKRMFTGSLLIYLKYQMINVRLLD
jgi:hypothetical protein